MGRGMPHPTTWLNGRQWEDEIPPEVPAVRPATPAAPSPSGFHQRVDAMFGPRRCWPRGGYAVSHAIDPGWADWIKHHGAVFGMTSGPDSETLYAWATVFDLANRTPDELIVATNRMALAGTRQENRWADKLPAARGPPSRPETGPQRPRQRRGGSGVGRGPRGSFWAIWERLRGMWRLRVGGRSAARRFGAQGVAPGPTAAPAPSCAVATSEPDDGRRAAI